MRWLFIAVLLLLLTACASSGTNAYHQGNVAYTKGDYRASLAYYHRAAELDNPNAQYALGYQYYYGLGTTPNERESIYWFRKAAPHVSNAKQALYMIDRHSEQIPWTLGLKK